ncbi:hypothetical protein DRO53_04405 [Candidatus Bathyarchaeota archaeon]|nr:MAG: hypothetical protein DRO53_04405 [Candidatus Bathyarchaeota archaeon]
MTLQYEALQKFIGKPAKDIYRRYIGYVVGITLDSNGRLNSVGVDRGGSFEECSSSQVIIEDDSLVLVPNWKMEAEKFRKEHDLTKKRFQALDELLKNHEIPEYVYNELCSQYKNSLMKLEEEHKTLIEGLRNRVKELENHIHHLERFLGHLKVQHKAGEISDETYTLASEYLNSVITKTVQAKKDVENTLNLLVSPPKEVEEAEYEELPPKPEVKPEKREGGEEPLVVRVIPQSEE